MVSYRIGSDSIEIGDLSSKVMITVTQDPFFSSKFSVNFSTVELSSLMSSQNEI